MTATKPEVYRVTNPVLPHVHPSDHIVVWPDGKLTLQREIDPETFTTLGTADALLPLRHRSNKAENAAS